jgi:alpha-D-ribose 1-methylphosphonate 5-triphosphate synthase subunit PhnH
MQPGLADPVLDGQRVFRAVLEAMSEPGRVVTLPTALPAPGPLQPATVALVLALVDLETPLWLDGPARTPEVLAHLRFHCGCPIVDEAAQARFAVVVEPESMPPLEMFDPGSAEYPDRSATVIVQVADLAAGSGRCLTGPGIATEARLHAPGLPKRFWESLPANRARFPRGVDVILTAGTTVAALPRTTRAED